MIWIIASLPFWVAAAWFLVAAPGVFANTLPGETAAETIKQFFVMLALGISCLVAAAWFCS